MNETALMEVAMCFGQHCKGPLAPSAREAFLEMYRKHIEKGLEAVPWEDHRRRVLRWTERIAEEAEARRGNGAVVTADQFRAACAAKIPAWQEECRAGSESYGPFCAAGTT